MDNKGPALNLLTAMDAVRLPRLRTRTDFLLDAYDRLLDYAPPLGCVCVQDRSTIEALARAIGATPPSREQVAGGSLFGLPIVLEPRMQPDRVRFCGAEGAVAELDLKTGEYLVAGRDERLRGLFPHD